MNTSSVVYVSIVLAITFVFVNISASIVMAEDTTTTATTTTITLRGQGQGQGQGPGQMKTSQEQQGTQEHSQEQPINRLSHHHRRHLLLEDNKNNSNNEYIRGQQISCVLYLKMISYEDGSDDSSWSCEFPHNYAQEHFNGRDTMDVQGITKEFINAHHAVSGETIMILTNTDAYVELSQSSQSSSSSSSLGNDNVFASADTTIGARVGNNDDIKLVVTDPSSVIFESLNEDDDRHYKKKRRNRRLSKRNTGTLVTLVVRTITPNGAVVDASTTKLKDDVFGDGGDEINLASQMAACSFNQVEIQPANVGDGGVVDVTLDINPIEDGNRDGNRGDLATSVRAKAEETYGGEDGLASQFDLIIFCLPPGSGTWSGFAYLNRYDSFYNGDHCSASELLMHEVGHNFGLSHSGNDRGDVYGDYTGTMGTAKFLDDGRRRCFNAVKNYQLGWYDLQIDSYNPLEYLNEDVDTTTPQSKEFILNGIAHYKTDGSARKGELISLRLEQFGDDQDNNPGVDYYLGYNRNLFPNDGVTQGVNQVILYSKDESIDNDVSRRLAMLQEGESYTIENYKGIVDATVLITVDSISDDLKDAVVRITTTPPPLPCDGIGRFKVEIGIDFPRENYWKLFEQNTNVLIQEGMAEEMYKRAVYVEPDDGTFYCLSPGCYNFTIYDSYGDGLIAANGGYYSGILDNNILFNSSKFQSNDTQLFCVEGNGDDPPTIPPITECIDDSTLRYTHKKKIKNCKWVGKKVSKRCELLSSQNKLLKEFCPITCGLCESITVSPSQIPTEAPTIAPSSTAPTIAPSSTPTTNDDEECVDDSTFKYKGVKQCGKWMAADLKKRCNLKAQAGYDEETNEPLLISDFCRMTCIEFNTCELPTPTTGDGASDGDDDDDDDDDTTCVDNSNFKYKGEDSKNCIWLGNINNKKKGKKRCRSKLEDGTTISDSCPFTCGLKFGIGKCKPE